MIDEKRLIEALASQIFSAEVYNDDFDGVVIRNLLCLGDVTAEVMKQLDEQPKVEEWIPCSERLPDTSTEVLVTLGYTYESDYTMYSIARYIHFENGECHWCDNHYGYLEWDKYSDGRGGDSSRRVIAWKPLPKLYKE